MNKNSFQIDIKECSVQWCPISKDAREISEFLIKHSVLNERSVSKLLCNTSYIIKVLCVQDSVAIIALEKLGQDWVLSHCVKTDYTIHNVLSEISKVAIQHLEADVISWIDYRLSDGSDFEEAGWMFEQLSPPDYFYHRALEVIDEEEHQTHINQANYKKVYDCGKMKYRYLWSE
jgi:hypothetical protein